MINFETSNSPFFLENKNYIENLIAKLEEFNPKHSGFCNAFGYDIEIKLLRSSHPTEIKLHKHQSTQSGAMKAVNAVDFYKTEIEFGNVFKNVTLKIGKSKINRLFTKSIYKSLLPAPYSVSSLKENFPAEVFEFILQHDLEEFTLENNTLKIVFHQKMEDLGMLESLEILLKDWV